MSAKQPPKHPNVCKLCLNQLIHHLLEISLRFMYKNSTSYTKKSDFTVLPTEFDASTKSQNMWKYQTNACENLWEVHSWMYMHIAICFGQQTGVCLAVLSKSWIFSQVCLDDSYTRWMTLIMAYFEENLQDI